MHEVSTEWTPRGYWVTVADSEERQTHVMVHPGHPVYGCRLDIEVGHIDRRSKLDYTEPEFAWVDACVPADKPAVLAAFSVWAANVIADHLIADGATDLKINFGCDSRVILDYMDREHEPTIMEAQATFMTYDTTVDTSSIALLDPVVLKNSLLNSIKLLGVHHGVLQECKDDGDSVQ